MIDEAKTIVVTVTCQVDGCHNSQIPITFEVAEQTIAFICGVCGQEIKDIIR